MANSRSLLKSTKVDTETLLTEGFRESEIKERGEKGGGVVVVGRALLITVWYNAARPCKASAFLRRLVKCPRCCCAAGNIFRLRLSKASPKPLTFHLTEVPSLSNFRSLLNPIRRAFRSPSQNCNRAPIVNQYIRTLLRNQQLLQFFLSIDFHTLF